MSNFPVTALAYSEESKNLAIEMHDGVVIIIVIIVIIVKSGNMGLSRAPKYVVL